MWSVREQAPAGGKRGEVWPFWRNRQGFPEEGAFRSGHLLGEHRWFPFANGSEPRAAFSVLKRNPKAALLGKARNPTQDCGTRGLRR